MLDLIKAVTILQAPVQQHAFRRQSAYSIEQAGMLLFLLNKLPSVQQDLVYKFSCGELSAFTGLHHSSATLQLATEDLGSRVFTIQSGRSYEQYRLFQSVTYLPNEEVKIKFTQSMLPYLHEWKKRLISDGLLPV